MNDISRNGQVHYLALMYAAIALHCTLLPIGRDVSKPVVTSLTFKTVSRKSSPRDDLIGLFIYKTSVKWSLDKKPYNMKLGNIITITFIK